MYIIMQNFKIYVKLESIEILGVRLILFIPSNSCHKKVLLESLNITNKQIYRYITSTPLAMSLQLVHWFKLSKLIGLHVVECQLESKPK